MMIPVLTKEFFVARITANVYNIRRKKRKK